MACHSRVFDHRKLMVMFAQAQTQFRSSDPYHPANMRIRESKLQRCRSKITPHEHDYFYSAETVEAHTLPQNTYAELIPEKKTVAA